MSALVKVLTSVFYLFLLENYHVFDTIDQTVVCYYWNHFIHYWSKIHTTAFDCNTCSFYETCCYLDKNIVTPMKTLSTSTYCNIIRTALPVWFNRKRRLQHVNFPIGIKFDKRWFRAKLKCGYRSLSKMVSGFPQPVTVSWK